MELNSIIKVEPKNYWVVKSQGYYKNFIEENFIMLVRRGLGRRRDYNMIREFIEEVSIGDIIIIPSSNKQEIAIGEISTEASLKPPFHKLERLDLKNYNERIENQITPWREVEWKKKLIRAEEYFTSKLLDSLHSHQLLKNVSNFDLFIEAAIHPIFIKDNEFHIVLKFNKDIEVPFNLLANFMSNFNLLSKDIAKWMGLELKEDDISIKIDVQSRGQAIISFTRKKLIKVGIGVVFTLGCVVGGQNLYANIGTVLDNIVKVYEIQQNINMEERKLELEEKKILLEHEIEERKLELEENKALLEYEKTEELKECEEELLKKSIKLLKSFEQLGINIPNEAYKKIIEEILELSNEDIKNISSSANLPSVN